MPTTYAHYRFGCDALNIMPSEIRSIVYANREIYDFGVHGPDLLFYYNPIYKNSVNRLGYATHERTGNSFFQQAAKTVNASLRWSESLSYAIGVLCHFALDRECHPYVAVKEQTGTSHSLIEASFDRFLMQKDNLVPSQYRITEHLIPSQETALLISEFYPPVSADQMLYAQYSMIFWLNMLNMKSGIPRKLVENSLGLLKLSAYKDMLVQVDDVPLCKDSDAQLFSLYYQALKLFNELLPEFIEYLQTGKPLGINFSHTFGAE